MTEGKIKLQRYDLQKGAALMIAVLFFLIISISVVLGAVGPFVRELQSSQSLIKSKASYYLAEAGGEDIVYRIKNSMIVPASSTLTLDGNTTTVAVVDTGGGKEITSEADVNLHIRKVKTDLTTSVTGVAFAYGAQVGEGGLILNNNASVEGTGGAVGNVYSNGPIVGINNSQVTGDATVAGNLEEDNQARSIVCNQDQIVGKSNPEIDFAQSFKPGDTQPLAKISLYIKKNGNPSSRPVYIVADNAGSPGTTILASGTLDKNLVGSSYGWIDVAFSSPATVTQGQTYWIVLNASRSSSKYWIWCKDSNNGFGNGVAKYRKYWNSGDPWALTSGDLAFKTFLGSGISSIDNVVIGGDARANTITNTSVGGDAYYDSNFSGSSASGTKYPGSADPSPLAMPISDANIADWESDAAAGGFTTGSCPGSAGCSNSMGPVKVNGDLNISEGTFTITGVIHVTGNFFMDNNVIVKCASFFGEDSCLILVDGWVNANNNVELRGSGDPDSYVLVVSTVEGCLGGTQQPQCTTNNSGLYLNNNVIGGLFYTTDSLLYMNNNVDVVSVIGYKVELNNNAVVIYETGVLDENFSSGPGGGWKVSSWRETE